MSFRSFDPLPRRLSLLLAQLPLDGSHPTPQTSGPVLKLYFLDAGKQSKEPAQIFREAQNLLRTCILGMNLLWTYVDVCRCFRRRLFRRFCLALGFACGFSSVSDGVCGQEFTYLTLFVQDIFFFHWAHFLFICCCLTPAWLFDD